MGLLGGLLDWIRTHKPSATARPAVRAGTAPRARTTPVEPIEQARNVTPTAAAPIATSIAVPAAAPAATPVDQEKLARERELKELRHSFQHGILDPRFRELDVDARFLEDFRKLVEIGVGEFAIPPAAAFDVMRIVDDPGYPVKKVAAAISCDPTIAGAVVSLANSPLHRGDVEVDTLPTAIVRLGQRHLRLLLLEIALGTTRVKAKPFEAFSTLAWKHSLLVAQLAHGLAKMSGQDADHAYMAGLFHDVGTFAVLAAARKLSNRQRRTVSPQSLLKLIDAHGHALGEKVIAGWHLPEPVTLAVVHRRSPHEAKGAAPLAAVTALANDLGRPLGAWVAREKVDLYHHAAVALLKLDLAQLPDEQAILEIALKIEKVAGLH